MRTLITEVQSSFACSSSATRFLPPRDGLKNIASACVQKIPLFLSANHCEHISRQFIGGGIDADSSLSSFLSSKHDLQDRIQKKPSSAVGWQMVPIPYSSASPYHFIAINQTLLLLLHISPLFFANLPLPLRVLACIDDVKRERKTLINDEETHSFPF